MAIIHVVLIDWGDCDGGEGTDMVKSFSSLESAEEFKRQLEFWLKCRPPYGKLRKLWYNKYPNIRSEVLDRSNCVLIEQIELVELQQYEVQQDG